jgi:hypothetical protein
MIAVQRTVYLSENGLEYDTQEEAQVADRAFQNLGALTLALREDWLWKEWKACGQRSFASALAAGGYMIVPIPKNPD